MPDRRPDLLATALRTAAGRIPPITLDEVLARPRLDIPGPDDWFDETDAGDHAGEEAHDTGGSPMVVQLEERRVERDDGSERPATGADPARWRRMALAAAAVAVVAVGIGVGVLRDGDDSRVEVAPADDQDASPGTDTSPEAVLDRFIDAVNERDEPTMIEFLDGGFVNGHLVDPSYLAAGDRWTRTGPCQPAGAEEVVCTVRREDDFHGAAGLVLELDVAAVVNDAGLLDKLMARGDDPYRQYVDFRSEFRTWVEQEHPDAGIRFYPTESSGGSADTADLPEEGSMPAALELVEDFVAQSEDYPVG